MIHLSKSYGIFSAHIWTMMYIYKLQSWTIFTTTSTVEKSTFGLYVISNFSNMGQFKAKYLIAILSIFSASLPVRYSILNFLQDSPNLSSDSFPIDIQSHNLSSSKSIQYSATLTSVINWHPERSKLINFGQHWDIKAIVSSDIRLLWTVRFFKFGNELVFKSKKPSSVNWWKPGRWRLFYWWQHSIIFEIDSSVIPFDSFKSRYCNWVQLNAICIIEASVINSNPARPRDINPPQHYAIFITRASVTGLSSSSASSHPMLDISNEVRPLQVSIMLSF